MAMKRVLIADDEPSIRAIIAQALHESGYDSDFACTADEEIARAAGNEYSVIITDNNMEDGRGNSGIYAIREIRKTDGKTPILFMTGNPSEQIMAEAVSAGATETFYKPFRVSDVLERVRTYSGNGNGKE